MIVAFNFLEESETLSKNHLKTCINNIQLRTSVIGIRIIFIYICAMRKSFLLILFIFIYSASFGQLEIGTKKDKDQKGEQKMKDESEDEIQKKKNKKELSITGRNVYMGISPGQSFRTLAPAETNFAKPLNQKANEKPIFSIRYQAGMQVILAKHLMLEFGFTYTFQGEQYSFKDEASDSTYAYHNKYRYIGVPLTINGIFGNESIRFYFGGGIAPMMFINQYEKINYTTETGSTNEIIRNIRDSRYNQFNLMVLGRIGLQGNFSKHFGYYIAPEFRYNLLNTFEKQYQHVHHQMAWGIDLGFIIYL